MVVSRLEGIERRYGSFRDHVSLGERYSEHCEAEPLTLCGRLQLF